MSDLFGRTDQLLNGGLSSDSLFMQWPELANNGLGMLIQQVSIDYRQPLRRIYELGPGFKAGDPNPLGAPGTVTATAQATYYIVGRPEGQLSFQRFIGPELITCEFYAKYGSPCAANKISLSGRAGCSASDPRAKNMSWDITGVVLNGYRGDANGQEMVMQENVGATFANLNIVCGDESTLTSAPGSQLFG